MKQIARPKAESKPVCEKFVGKNFNQSPANSQIRIGPTLALPCQGFVLFLGALVPGTGGPTSVQRNKISVPHIDRILYFSGIPANLNLIKKKSGKGGHEYRFSGDANISFVTGDIVSFKTKGSRLQQAPERIPFQAL